ncbi:MAG: septum formation initiator family protein [Mariprofundaceae bacterium]|nr:septum formation initiator family protein [Mariprofundaceae bacterium]
MIWALLAAMAYNLVFSDHGYLVYRKEQQGLSDLRAEVSKLRQQREKLAKEVLRLRHDPKALEELVHRELGYVHPDEYMLILPKKGTQKKGKNAHE